MKRSIVAVFILGLLPGCAAVQVPHRPPLPGKVAGLPIDPAEIMDDTSGIFDSFMDSGDLPQQPVGDNPLRLRLSLAVVNPRRAIDDITTIAAANHGSADVTDTCHLDLNIPTGSLKAVLAGIDELGTITELAYAGRGPFADLSNAETHPGKAVTAADFVLHLLDGSASLFTYTWMRDETVRAVDLIRERFTSARDQLRFTNIAVTISAIRTGRAGVTDYLMFFVKGIGSALKP